MQEKAIAELELERLSRDHKVERELLSRDINQHYARLYREGTLDMGFTTQVLLMHSARYQDAQRTDQLRGDLNAERDQRLLRALHDMEQRHASEIAIVKSGARKRTKIAEDKRRSECEAHNTSVLRQATSRIEATKAAKEKELLMREKEAAEMDMAVKAAVKEAVELKAKVAHDFELAHTGKNTINSAASCRVAAPATASSRIATPGRGREGIVTVEEAEAAELARLQQILDLERAQILRKIEREWQQAVNRRRPHVGEAVSRNSRPLGPGDQDNKEQGDGEQTPPTLKKSTRRRRESPKVNNNFSCI
jgi:hypothetical protein